MFTIAFIDTLGLAYDGSTLTKRGLGGSESAVILMSRELARLGFDVTVFNDCFSDDATPGTYDGVKYVPISQLELYTRFDFVIGSRSVASFAPEEIKHQFKWAEKLPNLERVVMNSAYRILWMHDTFCDGDTLIEPFVMAGRIHEIFTLSDFHTTYITNCDHGNRRNFEVLKNRVFQTRNGIISYRDWVDIREKDPNQFVFNASISKGMIPLIERIWPRVKQQIPEAKLKVIGGYYRFREEHGPDEQEMRFHAMVQHYNAVNPHLDVEFTGIIKQSEIAEILAKSSYMIYPAAFPETFGISCLESLNYNTPLITCQFGALEETAIDAACYKIPYAIEPNSLFPNINTDQQIEKFVGLVLYAYNNKYLHQQKMYACNQVRDICSWATVALQWKQRLFKIAGEYLPVEEYRQVDHINRRVRKVFGRRFYNAVEDTEPSSASQKHIAIISPVFNAESFVNRCVRSVAQQDYHNYTMYLINDASTDNSLAALEWTIGSLPENIRGRFRIINREHRTGSAVFNQIDTLRKHVTSGDDIVMFLDGDDWLVNDATIFHKYNNLYHQGAEFTYGSCWSVVDGIPLIAQPYPPEVKATRDYRNYKFNWQMPYTHLRTFKRSLLDNLSDDVFKDSQGQWYRAGGDNATFYNLIEQADPDRVICVPDLVYHYNDTNPLNDYKVNGIEQNQTAAKILGSPKSSGSKPVLAHKTTVTSAETITVTKAQTPMKRILVGIPTARYIEPDTFKSIFDLIVPEGYDLDFQYFYGYNVDQVRNLIADWTVKGYDYLFSVDHDIAFAPDTLVKLLSHDKPMVTGVYRQRLDPEVLEVYGLDGGNLPYGRLKSHKLVEVGGCGFGCVLVKREVFAAVGYPQFVYHSALDHRNTLSEDVDFCIKARQKGFTIWCDPSILCDHHGQRVFRVNTEVTPERVLSQEEQHLRDVSKRAWLPQEHISYLTSMKQQGIEPKVMYDIGACVLHWTHEAKKLWPNSEIILFEAMSAVESLYQEEGYRYFLGPLGEQDGVEVDFYENLENPGGNSYFRENPELSPNAPLLFPESNKKRLTLSTLDTLVRKHHLPLPDLIKMDIQGAELAVLRGASYALSKCDHLILELQHKDYNLGAPKRDEVIEYLRGQGYQCVSGMFSGSEEGADGDYHFVRVPQPEVFFQPQIISEPMPLRVVTLELPGFGS